MIVFVIKNCEIILIQIPLMKLVFFCKPQNDGWVRAWVFWGFLKSVAVSKGVQGEVKQAINFASRD